MSEETTEVAASTDSGTSSWHEGLPNDMRGNETLANIPDVTTLAKSYLDAQSYMGGSIRVPGKDAGDADWQAFNDKLAKQVPDMMRLPKDEKQAREALYRRLGRPDSPEGYNIEGAKPGFLKWAHENGLSQQQAEAWMKNSAQQSEQRKAARDTQMKEATQMLKKEWGHAYDQKLSSAKQAVQAYADQETQKFLVDSGLANHPGMIRFMASIGATLNEDQTAGMSGGTRFTLSPSEALDQISEIQRNDKHPYNVPGHPQHMKEVDKVRRLFQQAYPEAS